MFAVSDSSERVSISGLRFRITDLRRRPGSILEEVRSVSPGAQRIGDAEVAEQPVEVSVRLESLSDGLRVDGTVGYRWTAPCRRCLEPAAGEETVGFRELFVDDPSSYVSSTPGGASGGDEDVHQITGDWLDLGEIVRDAVLLGLPLAPLCGPDCGGPAPEMFPVEVKAGSDTAAEPEGAAADGPGDPRWAALSELDFDGPGT